MRYLGVCAWVTVSVLALVLIPVAVFGAADKDSFEINGYVAKSANEPGSRLVVKLVDPESGKVLDMTTSGVFGKFKFEKVKPGLYLLQVGEVKREILLKNKNLRADIDLSAKDGVYRSFTAEKLAAAIGGAAGGGGPAAGPAPGPNDANLQQSMAGEYWGYQGSTETSMTLCGSGQFSENSESSYSGRMSDGLGNQTGAWGTANQRGSAGNWSVQGDLQQGTINLAYSSGKTATVRYRAVDRGCYSFDGRTLCRKGAANCR